MHFLGARNLIKALHNIHIHQDCCNIHADIIVSLYLSNLNFEYNTKCDF